ncbi:hypothetical protein K439DRAFT_1653513 [Ramaria rubella]|nr:hypothetical protein K439DRAFT_1653513 [Ramaria rubella]
MPHKEPDTPVSHSGSYVYPVRSLFTGIHAPASLMSPSRGSDSISCDSDSLNQNTNITGTTDTSDNEVVIQRNRMHNDKDEQYLPGENNEQHSFVTRPAEFPSDDTPAPLMVSDGYIGGSDSESTRSSLASAGLVHLAPIRRDSSLPCMDMRSHCTHGSQTGSQFSDPNHKVTNASALIHELGDGGSTSSIPLLESQEVDREEPLMTFRFEHVQSRDCSHHVVTGREGKLTKCEDEPIRVPGAVQGFGVLVALREDEDALIARQVSENASELLGLSPQYLFSLDCFSRVLPDSQADILWDNILNCPDSMEPGQSPEGPQIFLLSGWGEPGSAIHETGDAVLDRKLDRRPWTCWCAAHRSPTGLIVLEFELERDIYNPLYPSFPTDSASSESSQGSGGSTGSRSSLGPASTAVGGTSSKDSFGGSGTFPPLIETQGAISNCHAISQRGLQGDDTWTPSAEDVLESTTSHSKPLRALERMRRLRRSTAATDTSTQSGRGSKRRGSRTTGIGTMDIFSVLAQVNDQLASAPDLDSFLKVTVGVIKDLCQFHRVLVYQFDEMWNGQVVAELVDWTQTHDLYKNLHFPASDIPAQARELYCLNKVRLLYDRSQITARLVVRDRSDLDPPLDMTHAYLRAMSPIHVKYLGNMGVRASMSISIVAFGTLWGLIACHSYGDHGMRVSFPVRQMLRLLSDSISHNIERLSYAHRLRTRKLISTLPTDSHPTGYIVSNAEDLLSLFDADFGVLVVGEGAKILGPNEHGQEILILAEYLRLRQFELMQVSQAVTVDFPDLVLPAGLEVIAGLLYVPLSSGGKDFIVFLRKGQLRDVHWAGKPFKDGTGTKSMLEPRTSFKMWSETIIGRCRVWTDEQLETAGVLALVYGKFIEVWRQKETVLQTTQLTNLLLSNASHEVRTPLNHIINYLELALNGPLDGETRENLTRSYTASKSLLFTINDLLDLTRLESGGETSFSEPFDLHATIEEAVHLYRIEAHRRGIEFHLHTSNSQQFVVGDSKKIRTVLGNLVANAIKYTSEGKVTVECHNFSEPPGLRAANQIAVEITVADTGCGIDEAKLENMFREFEQVESTTLNAKGLPGLGLGLAVVARIIAQLGGQLRIDSKLATGSRFSFLIPFVLNESAPAYTKSGTSSSSHSVSDGSGVRGINSLVEAMSTNPMESGPKGVPHRLLRPKDGPFPIEGSTSLVPSVKVDEFDLDKPLPGTVTAVEHTQPAREPSRMLIPSAVLNKLRVLVVDDDTVNRTILSKRLTLDGHEVLGRTNGQEGVQAIESDRSFDCVLMDIQMPILNGFEATKKIRALEAASPDVSLKGPVRTSLKLNGRIPIFAVSASLAEHQRNHMSKLGLDGWILKPIDFKRLNTILCGITDVSERRSCLYHIGCNWEAGGWLSEPSSHAQTW